ncbi:immunoglobulin superfamily containing leucine-rich repeat protein-like [Sceloporus undulatus]|uniref:immunoglobulin superfamily containing leucine-rich repeat protein-like n=1 Tax=Sceloporus undulatus TaxID=8520 RepID=UPI001C4B1643|nr:immunoglobulin superfamily containing leucine-rich repeat protein-like [Sceloporus undulatus]
MDPLFCLLMTLFLVGIQCCPEVCRCVAQKKYGRHIVDCSYKDLQAVPLGLPSNATTLTLSVNSITSLGEDSFVDSTNLQALWMSYNEISTIARGTFAFLVQLRAIDLSHNQIRAFPWGDLSNLTALQQLKLSSNRLDKVPLEAFQTLKDLRALWLDNNQLAVLSEGTFDSMSLLSQLQINNNPLNCSCRSWWLKKWLENTTVSIPEKESITCAAPEHLKGLILGRTLKMDCMLPSVQLVYHSSMGNSVLHDGLTLLLHCSAVGKPPPEIRWKIQTAAQNVAINGPNIEAEGDNVLASVTSKQNKGGRFLVFKNGSMAISNFNKADEGFYTCQALNDVGSREVSVNVALASSENPADQLQNDIQASKPKDNPCDKEHPKSEEKVVFIYLSPIVPKASGNGGTMWDSWLWMSSFLVSLLPFL